MIIQQIRSRRQSTRRQYCQAALVLTALSAGAVHGGALPAGAVTMRVAPDAPQPGDVFSVTLAPAAGEKIQGVGMAAFDTPQVKFYARRDGSVRALVGLPFDRKGGLSTLTARVQFTRDGKTVEQVLSTALRARARYFPTQHISMKSSTATTMSKTGALRAEKRVVQNAMKNSYPGPLWSGSWVIPTRGRSTSSYGRRRYVNGKWWGQHNGADIKAPTGAPVVAMNTGRVVLSQSLPTLRGNCIVVDHGCNVFSIYMHLSQRLVNVGQSVRRGQMIGRVGATGFVTGAHLHWEVRIGWEPVDPIKIVHAGLQF
ncbi:MAG TPA: M23 family metallopeptidase [Abditibacteriaceae bacterium]|nr:M23 family metallopeptidase [Abditibacteriaceae bacterium]